MQRPVSYMSTEPASYLLQQNVDTTVMIYNCHDFGTIISHIKWQCVQQHKLMLTMFPASYKQSTAQHHSTIALITVYTLQNQNAFKPPTLNFGNTSECSLPMNTVISLATHKKTTPKSLEATAPPNTLVINLNKWSKEFDIRPHR